MADSVWRMLESSKRGQNEGDEPGPSDSSVSDYVGRSSILRKILARNVNEHDQHLSFRRGLTRKGAANSTTNILIINCWICR
jgi:hypothetical protein